MLRAIVIFQFALLCINGEGSLPDGIFLRNDIPQRCVDNSARPVSCSDVTSSDSLLEHPDDCNLFYYCVDQESKAICRQCPADLHFNPIKHVCDRKEDAGCHVANN